MIVVSHYVRFRILLAEVVPEKPEVPEEPEKPEVPEEPEKPEDPEEPEKPEVPELLVAIWLGTVV